MRIKRLSLSAYGPFTDRALEFGDGRGVHVIFGANEAGKSTTLRALGSVLFGYPRDAIDLHGRQTRDVLLGGVLEDRTGRELSFTRRRVGSPLLRDEGGAALGEGAVASALGGISRELFERVFALSHDRLTAHALSLLSDDGTLGYSLFETGAGVRGVKSALAAMRDEAERLFLPKGQREINQSIKRLTDVKSEARRHMLRPDRFQEMEAELALAERALAASQAEKRRLETERTRLARLGRNQPRAARHKKLAADRAALGEVAVLRASFSSERERAERALAVAERAEEAARGEIAPLESELAGLSVDERVLAEREAIARLGEWRGRVKAFEEDLPKRQADLARIRERIAALAREAGMPESDAARAIPTLLARKKVAGLANDGEALAAEARTLAAALVRAKEKSRVSDGEKALGEPARDVTGLSAALVSLAPKGDLGAQVDELARAFARKTEKIALRVKSLGVASGRIVDLAALPYPQATAVERFRAGMERAERDCEAAENELKRVEVALRVEERRLSAIDAGQAPPTMLALRKARADRDEAWAIVRGRFVEERSDLEARAASFDPPRPIAEAYERRVTEADRISDALRDEARRGAEYELLVAKVKELSRARDEARSQRDTVRTARTELSSAWRALAEPAGIDQLAPAEALDRMRDAKALLSDAEALATDEEALASRTRARDEAQHIFATELVGVGVTLRGGEPLSSLVERARLFVERQQALGNEERQRARTAATAVRDHDDAHRALETAEQAITSWRARFTEALAAIGLAADTTVEQARSYLDLVKDLDAEQAKASDLLHRIEGMEKERGEFDRRVSRLAAAALPERRFAGTIEASVSLEKALAEAEDARAKETLLKERCLAQRVALAEATRAQAAERSILDALCKEARCTQPSQLSEAEARAVLAATLDRQLADVADELLADGGGADPAAVIAASEGRDPDALMVERNAVEERWKAVDAEGLALAAKQALLQKEAEELGNRALAGPLLQQAENEATVLGDLVERFAALAVSEALVTAALERYRERNQGPILKRATGLFSQLTDGAFSGLQLDSEGKEEKPILVAVRANNGSHLEVGQLSDGTRDQLYLALRLAVIQEHNAAREPLPFIADDLLLNFDDGRSAAAFRTLAEIGGHNQVLFFTHHEHMVALAKRAVPAHLLHFQSLNS